MDIVNSTWDPLKKFTDHRNGHFKTIKKKVKIQTLPLSSVSKWVLSVFLADASLCWA